MGMIYKRGEVFWIKYYSRGNRSERAPGRTNGKRRNGFCEIARVGRQWVRHYSRGFRRPPSTNY